MSRCEIGQIFKIFETLGTPNQKSWPGIIDLPDYKWTFPQWKPGGLKKLVENIDDLGVDLLGKLLEYDPVRRITAEEALEHPYFGDYKRKPNGRMGGIE